MLYQGEGGDEIPEQILALWRDRSSPFPPVTKGHNRAKLVTGSEHLHQGTPCKQTVYVWAQISATDFQLNPSGLFHTAMAAVFSVQASLQFSLFASLCRPCSFMFCFVSNR
jgi:hypothetical protein